eukprot:613406-Hanusia_phi.AAC.1
MAGIMPHVFRILLRRPDGPGVPESRFRAVSAASRLVPIGLGRRSTVTSQSAGPPVNPRRAARDRTEESSPWHRGSGIRR